MRTRSASAVAALAGATALVIGTALPAAAHEEINPKTFPTGQPTFFTLTAANEASADLVKIVLKAPTGLAFGETTRSPAGWSVSPTDTTITWTGGAVKPDTFETWGFEIEGADQPGILAYTVTLGFAGGKTEDHEVDVNATPGTAGGATPATTVTTAAATSTTASGTAAPGPGAESGGDSGGASGTAKAALAVSIIALLVAAGALAVAGRRRSAGPGGGGPSGADRPSGAAQDW
ncbi:MAG: hypothetical protein LC792_24380 [Actinobacteria bacterium]|nr:hypothetical protein [Actinomycetota bacterium]